MDFRIGTNNISYSNGMQTKPTKGVERQSFQGSMEKVVQKQKVKPTQDSIEFSGESDYKKLEKIKELNDSTDFSGMTDIEKYSVIYERYEKAFPDFSARIYVGSGIKVNADMQKQYLEDLKKAKTKELYQVYKGYDKMTDEQKWESIQKEYGNPKNGIEQICALLEMVNAGLVDGHACSTMVHHLEHQVSAIGVSEYIPDWNFYDATEQGQQYIYEYLQNNKVNFEDIKNGVMASITISADFGDINEQIQRKQQLGYEMDYITELMNALEERED